MFACFVISTGRCATQWLAHTLAQWSTLFVVEHEPLHLAYRPDRNSPQQPLAVNAKLLQAHVHRIEQCLAAGRIYIETGFPCWRHLQWLRQQLQGRVKVLHLHRHPLQTVLSLLKLNAFVPPLLPHLPVKNFYLPGNAQDYLAAYAELWPALNPAEKNLWYWAEVQVQALRYQQQWPQADWLRLGFAELFLPAAKQQLADFFGLCARCCLASNSTSGSVWRRYGTFSIKFSYTVAIGRV